MPGALTTPDNLELVYNLDPDSADTLHECGVRLNNEEASQALRRHLEHTIENLQQIRPILER
jgi:hypothetical protein